MTFRHVYIGFEISSTYSHLQRQTLYLDKVRNNSCVKKYG